MNMRQTIFGTMILLAVTAVIFAATARAMEVTVQGEGIPPVLLEEILIPYPYIARNEVYGYAEVLFVVDEQGVPRDFVVLRDTNPAFSRAIIWAIEDVRYEPAKINGVAVPARMIFKNHFHYRGQAALLGPEETLPDRKEIVAQAVDRVRSLDELDAPLTAVEKVAPSYPESLQDEALAGGVMVEFYVSPEGTVKAPMEVTTSHPAFSAAALEAIRAWRFEPPRVNGKPVTTVARQPFSFGEAPTPP